MLNIIDEVDLRIAELQAGAEYSSDDFERDKMQPNATFFDEWEDDYDQYDND